MLSIFHFGFNLSPNSTILHFRCWCSSSLDSCICIGTSLSLSFPDTRWAAQWLTMRLEATPPNSTKVAARPDRELPASARLRSVWLARSILILIKSNRQSIVWFEYDEKSFSSKLFSLLWSCNLHGTGMDWRDIFHCATSVLIAKSSDHKCCAPPIVEFVKLN